MDGFDAARLLIFCSTVRDVVSMNSFEKREFLSLEMFLAIFDLPVSISIAIDADGSTMSMS